MNSEGRGAWWRAWAAVDPFEGGMAVLKGEGWWPWRLRSIEVGGGRGGAIRVDAFGPVGGIGLLDH